MAHHNKILKHINILALIYEKSETMFNLLSLLFCKYNFLKMSFEMSGLMRFLSTVDMRGLLQFLDVLL